MCPFVGILWTCLIPKPGGIKTYGKNPEIAVARHSVKLHLHKIGLGATARQRKGFVSFTE
jgi:hypothetical protein